MGVKEVLIGGKFRDYAIANAAVASGFALSRSGHPLLPAVAIETQPRMRRILTQ